MEVSLDHAMTLALDLGSAEGPKVAVKECLAIAGLPTRCGSAAFENAPAEAAHADAVQSLIDAGCHIVGRANMHELAYGMTGANAHTGTPANPIWPDRIPGGSSSGSAALVAAGMVAFAIGTDTGGSIRQPAACCGVYGFKPTFGRVSRKGAIPVGSSLDCIGPFAASAPWLTRAMEALDPTFTRATVPAPRLVVIETDSDADIAQAFETTAARLSPVARRSLTLMGAAFTAGMTVIAHEIAAEFGAMAMSNATLGEDVRNRIVKARDVSNVDRSKAEAIRMRFTAEVDAALKDADALILPTLPCVPPTWEKAQDPQAILPLTKFVRPFNLSGHPALTIPLLTADGLPAGLQLVGRKGDDARLVAIAETIAKTLGKDA